MYYSEINCCSGGATTPYELTGAIELFELHTPVRCSVSCPDNTVGTSVEKIHEMEVIP